MDEFIPQTGGVEVREGHEDSDINFKAIVICLASLATAGALTFVVAAMLVSSVRFVGLQWWERQLFGEVHLTPVQQQLQTEREVKPGVPTTAREGARTPDWYGRGEMEDHLGKTFPVPRLQYDDAFDLDVFRGSEDTWLDSTGKDADGAIHIPVARAMDLLSQRGLPSVSGAFLPANAPANVLAPELSPGPEHPTTTTGGGRSR